MIIGVCFTFFGVRLLMCSVCVRYVVFRFGFLGRLYRYRGVYRFGFGVW